MCHHTIGEPAVRFTSDVISLHRQLGFRGLVREVGRDRLLHLEERGDGLLTLAVRSGDLPHRYLLGIQGFRLAQYLQLGWICEETVYSSALFAEPGHGSSEDAHVICMDHEGVIQGYLCLTANGEGPAEDLHAPDRALFPVEEAHRINIFDHVPPTPGVRTDQVREVKRFVHARTLTDKTQRLRVTLELLYGMGRVLQDIRPAVRTLVGDLEEKVALRHLLLGGFEVQLIEGTTPALEQGSLLHHMYVARGSVKPFVAHMPDEDDLAGRLELLEQTLGSSDLFDATSAFGRATGGALHRVAA